MSVWYGDRQSVPKVQHKVADFQFHAGQAVVLGLFLASPLCPVYRHQYAEKVASSSFCAALVSEALFPRFLFRWKWRRPWDSMWLGSRRCWNPRLLREVCGFGSSRCRLGVFVAHVVGRFVTGSKKVNNRTTSRSKIDRTEHATWEENSNSPSFCCKALMAPTKNAHVQRETNLAEVILCLQEQCKNSFYNIKTTNVLLTDVCLYFID